jgi:integrase
MRALDRRFRLAEMQRDEAESSRRLWRFCRQTAWRLVKLVMRRAGVYGRPACPRGLRHGFGVGTLQAEVPVTLVKRWMGHARLSTTEIYLAVSGPEEHAFAERYWQAVRTTRLPKVCQSARKTDPGSACNFDPPLRLESVSGSPAVSMLS